MGTKHQAGSDSYVTALAFFKIMKEYYVDQSKSIKEFKNYLFGVDEEVSDSSWFAGAGLPQYTITDGYDQGYAATGMGMYRNEQYYNRVEAYRTYSPSAPQCVTALSN